MSVSGNYDKVSYIASGKSVRAQSIVECRLNDWAEYNVLAVSARAVFGGGSTELMPTTELTADDLTDGTADILTLLVKTGLCSSKSDARRNVQQGGVTANDEKVDDIARAFTEDELKAGVVLRRGKKNFNKALLK